MESKLLLPSYKELAAKAPQNLPTAEVDMHASMSSAGVADNPSIQRDVLGEALPVVPRWTTKDRLLTLQTSEAGDAEEWSRTNKVKNLG